MTTAEATTRPAGLNPDLEHFIDIAYQGRRAGASGGEKRARRIAECLLENLPGLDDSAVAGLKKYIDCVQGSPEAAGRVIGKR